MVRPLALILALLIPSAVLADGTDPIARFCGPEPKTDPAATGPVKVAERLLDRILTTRGKVFAAYRTEYYNDRKRILNRNKRLPKKQHLPVPPARSDEELKQTKAYIERLAKAHASLEDESAARKKLDAELAKLQEATAAHQRCRDGILERMRTAASKDAVTLLKIAANERLKEEVDRLEYLKSQYLQVLEVNRKDRKIMVPIISASICAHGDLAKDVKSEMRAITRQAKITQQDPSEGIAVLKERLEEINLEVLELRRDLKAFRGRQARCGGPQAALITCIVSERRSPGSNPPQCEQFAMELQLLGYAERRWK